MGVLRKGDGVVANPADVVMGRFQLRSRDDNHVHVLAVFNCRQPGAFFVEQVRGHVHRKFADDLGRPFLAGFLTHDSQHRQGQ
jgi:hypothetical protein